MKPSKPKILIADTSADFLHSCKNEPKAAHYHIQTAKNAAECLEKLKNFKPDLVIAEFMLPGMHGIELLHRIKETDHKTGVILTCYHIMFQNYNSATRLGVDYLIEKPLSFPQLFKCVSLFFEGKLQPPPFPQKEIPPHTPISLEKQAPPSFLKFWGTRGSNPVAGSEYVRFGGNTPCLEVRHGKDLVIFDAGSGIRSLGQVLTSEAENKINLILSHTHWDHLLGFPFFYPIHQPNKEITIWTPVGFEKTTKELFADMLAYAYFPVSFDDIRSKLVFKDMRDGQTISFGSIKVSTHYAFHPGPTLCFKIHVGHKTIGYVTDNEFLLGCHLPPSKIAKKESLFEPYQSLIEFLKGCDVLIHEAQYMPEEYLLRVGWGHSSLYNASFLLKKTGIKDWIVVHHDPRHTDDFLLEKQQLHMKVLEDIEHDCHVRLAYDGMMLPI